MPHKPKKPCGYPGCPKLTDGKWCDYHKTLFPDKFRSGSKDPFYSSKEWRNVRRRFLAENPFCVCCGRAAEVVDHITPLKDGGAPLEESNLQSLCWSCHSIKSYKEGSRFRRKTYSY